MVQKELDILKLSMVRKVKLKQENCMKICPRQALHARTLGFVHPTSGQQMDFTSSLPEDMETLVARWRKYMLGNELKIQ